MERDKEIAKLVNILRRTARMATHIEWTGSSADAASYSVEQYNRVLVRLKEIDPELAPVFEPLATGSSLAVVGMACRQLAAYYEDEVHSRRWGGYSVGFDPEAFKDFWCKSSREIEDLGEFIRESVDEWVKQKRSRKPEEKQAEPAS
ncbi:MAG TPA: hypothetical protein VJX67_25840 [Blastocatellia bacterium]|nr:hypothetical protein [Blastocatellia bacterium]